MHDLPGEAGWPIELAEVPRLTIADVERFLYPFDGVRISTRRCGDYLFGHRHSEFGDEVWIIARSEGYAPEAELRFSVHDVGAIVARRLATTRFEISVGRVPYDAAVRLAEAGHAHLRNETGVDVIAVARELLEGKDIETRPS